MLRNNPATPDKGQAEQSKELEKKQTKRSKESKNKDK